MSARRWIVGVVTVGLLAMAGCGDGGGSSTAQGGSRSVVLTYDGSIDRSELEAAVRRRLDGYELRDLDTADPGVVRLTISGASEELDEAVDALVTRGELRFRPVLSVIPGRVEDLLEATPAPTDPGDEPGVTTGDPPDGGSDLADAYRLTPRAQDLAGRLVTLAEHHPDDPREVVATYRLGPTAVTGAVVSRAAAELGPDDRWAVHLEIEAGAGIESFNAIAAECNAGAPTCPAQGGGAGQLAIVVDSKVVSAPTISQPAYERDQIQISGSFTRRQAALLARVLRSSLPVDLVLHTAGPLPGR